jgi:hypothetical protein
MPLTVPSARVVSVWSFTSTYPIFFYGVVLGIRDKGKR